MKITVEFGENIIDSSFQEKSFKDEYAAMEWCMRNHKKIWQINNFITHGQKVSHFELMDAFRGLSN